MWVRVEPEELAEAAGLLGMDSATAGCLGTVFDLVGAALPGGVAARCAWTVGRSWQGAVARLGGQITDHVQALLDASQGYLEADRLHWSLAAGAADAPPALVEPEVDGTDLP
jgi:hypothetical protein